MTDKVVLVSGGTSGVGLEVARQAIGAGWRVFITGTSGKKLDAARDLFKGESRLYGCVADTCSPVDSATVVAQALERFGRLDAMVASAGRGAQGDFLSGDPEEWRSMVLTNVLGPAVMARAALPALQEAKGHVVFVGSVFGTKPAPGNLYSATKFAVAALADSLRQQLVGSGMRVSVVHPGRIDTPWWPDGAPPPALSAGSVAEAVLWLLSRPADVDVNEVVLRPTGQQF